MKKSIEDQKTTTTTKDPGVEEFKLSDKEESPSMVRRQSSITTTRSSDMIGKLIKYNARLLFLLLLYITFHSYQVGYRYYAKGKEDEWTQSAEDYLLCILTNSVTDPNNGRVVCGDAPEERNSIGAINFILFTVAGFGIIPFIVFGLGEIVQVVFLKRVFPWIASTFKVTEEDNSEAGSKLSSENIFTRLGRSIQSSVMTKPQQSDNSQSPSEIQDSSTANHHNQNSSLQIEEDDSDEEDSQNIPKGVELSVIKEESMKSSSSS